MRAVGQAYCFDKRALVGNLEFNFVWTLNCKDNSRCESYVVSINPVDGLFC